MKGSSDMGVPGKRSDAGSPWSIDDAIAFASMDLEVCEASLYIGTSFWVTLVGSVDSGGFMRGDKEIISKLNEVLTGELTAISQYFLHARICKNWGLSELGSKIEKESIDEMKHASNLMDRILFLEGLPNLQKLDKMSIGQNVEEILQSDLALEHRAVALLRDGIVLCDQKRDYTSRELLEDVLEDEENHIDWIETQLELIKTLGLQNYLTTKV